MDHIAGRPAWDCVVCDKPWPCEAVREHLAAEMDRVKLSMVMWDYLQAAAQEMPNGPPGELFERFIRWTG